jgi:hypothetical protein
LGQWGFRIPSARGVVIESGGGNKLRSAPEPGQRTSSPGAGPARLHGI